MNPFNKFDRFAGRDYEGTAGTEINYRQLLLYQLKITIESMTQGAWQFSNAVNGTEILLIPHHDEKYKDAAKQLQEKIESHSVRISRSKRHQTDHKPMYNLQMWAAEQKFRLLMELIGRASLLPEKDVELLED